jgi:L-tartrate/succinate antiporter
VSSTKPVLEKAKTPAQSSGQKPLLRWAITIGLGLLLWICPVPAGLTPVAWRFFALFAAVVAALVAEPIPSPAVGFIGVSAATVLMLVGNSPAEAMRWALSGFSNDTVWLIMAAAMFALGYEKTGLGRRIALLLVKTLGKSTLGLGYAIALADLILAPFMPSATARSGGTIYPVVKNIPPLYGSYPLENPRRIGSYLCWTAFATACVTSSMFATSLAPNLLAIELVKKITHVEITWTGWMLGFLPVGILVFLATPLLLYWIYPPEIKRGDKVQTWAATELAQMGPVSRHEITMAALAVLALLAWILGTNWLAAVTVAALVISLMVLTGVVSWNDIVSNKQAWNVWIWFATLVTLADGLNRVGFLSWFAKRSSALIAHFPITPMIIMLLVLFWAVHYCFASATAHTTAVLPVFLAAIVTVSGIPLKPVALLLVYSLGIQGVISPYAHGAAPIWYSAGYISTRDFWRIGAILGFIYLLVLLLVGFPFLLKFMR